MVPEVRSKKQKKNDANTKTWLCQPPICFLTCPTYSRGSRLPNHPATTSYVYRLITCINALGSMLSESKLCNNKLLYRATLTIALLRCLDVDMYQQYDGLPLSIPRIDVSMRSTKPCEKKVIEMFAQSPSHQRSDRSDLTPWVLDLVESILKALELAWLACRPLTWGSPNCWRVRNNYGQRFVRPRLVN